MIHEPPGNAVGKDLNRQCRRQKRLRHLAGRSDKGPAIATATKYLDDPDPLFAVSAVQTLARTGGAAGIVTLAATAGYQWTQGQYYVAPEGSVVAIHRGVDLQILGIPLHSVAETTPIQLTDLPPYNQELVAEGINASDLDKAEQIVSDLKDLACQQAREAAPAKPDSTGGSTALLPPYCEGTLP